MLKVGGFGLRVTLVLMTCVVNAGCATVAAPVIRPIIDRSPIPLWGAQHANAHDRHTMTWTSSLPGEKKYTGPSIEDARLVDAGEYRNWSWRIVGPTIVLQAYADWQHSLSAEKLSDERAYNWESGMRRLYHLTGYLLKVRPLPINVDTILVPDGKAYKLAKTSSIGNTVPITIASHFDVTTNTDAFEDMRETLSVIGGQLQHAELIVGVTSAPSAGKARTFKDEANSLCWRVAVRAALAVYTDSRLKISDPSHVDAATSLLAAMHTKYPEDKKVRGTYAMALIVGGASEYLDSRGIPWPQTGRDLSGINALLEYCRAFVHYAGNVADRPLPLEDIERDPFFDVASKLAHPGGTT